MGPEFFNPECFQRQIPDEAKRYHYTPWRSPNSMSNLASVRFLFGSNLERYFQLLNTDFSYVHFITILKCLQLISFFFFLKSSLFLFILNGLGIPIQCWGGQDLPITRVLPFVYKSVKLHFELWLCHAECSWGWTLLWSFSKTGIDIPKNDIRKYIFDCNKCILQLFCWQALPSSCCWAKSWNLAWRSLWCQGIPFAVLLKKRLGCGQVISPCRDSVCILAYSHIWFWQKNPFDGGECFEHFQLRNSARLTAAFATSSWGPLWI